MKVKGIVNFIEINAGAWTLDAEDGQIYELLNCPEQIKFPGKQVELSLDLKKDFATINMVGIPAKVIGFET